MAVRERIVRADRQQDFEIEIDSDREIERNSEIERSREVEM